MFPASTIYGTPFPVSQSHLIWFLAGLVVVQVLLLLIVRSVYRRRLRRELEQRRIDESMAETRSQELEWYREKRFLMERQAREKQDRLAELVDSLEEARAHALAYPVTRLFFFAETIREERQQLGTDISKLTLIGRRLDDLGRECLEASSRGTRIDPFLTEVRFCRQVLENHLDQLRHAQNLLRKVLAGVSIHEERARRGEIGEDEVGDLISELEDAKDQLSELPDALKTIARSTGEKAQALFRESSHHLPGHSMHAVWQEQMRLDLFSSKHRPGGRGALLDAADRAIEAFEAGETSAPAEDGDSPPQREEGDEIFGAGGAPIPESAEVRVPALDFAGDQPGEGASSAKADGVWVAPESGRSGSLPEDGADEDGAGEAPREIVIFCSHDPSIWNSHFDEGETNRAMALDDVRGDYHWIGIRRLDTGEEVFFEVGLEELKASGDGKSVGFNGSNEFFYGARHLGLFSEECAPEVETRFTYGGWGFGHLASSSDEHEENTQVCGWNGRQLPEGTVLQFTLYAELPFGVESRQLVV